MTIAKVLFLTLLLNFSVPNLKAQVILNYESNKEVVKGKVKKITIKQYEATSKFGKAELGPLIKECTYVFGRNGKEIEYIYHQIQPYSGDGKYQSIYNSKGKLIEWNEFNLQNKLTTKYTCTYDAKDSLTEETWYNGDGKLRNKKTYKFDNNGNNIETVYYNSDRGINTKYIYSYTGKNLTEEKGYNSKGDLEYFKSYFYDNKNRKIKDSSEQFSESHRLRLNTIKYNNAGKIIEGVGYNLNNKSIEGTRYTYDNQNMLTHSDHFEDLAENLVTPRITSQTDYVYDKANNLIEQKRVDLFDNTNSIDQFSKFDQFQNWLYYTHLFKDEPNIIITRIIEYY